MNIHPVVASEGERLLQVIREESERYEAPTDHLVLEITEQASFVPSERTIERVMNLKAAGVQFAFDDLGIALHRARDASTPLYEQRTSEEPERVHRSLSGSRCEVLQLPE